MLRDIPRCPELKTGISARRRTLSGAQATQANKVVEPIRTMAQEHGCQAIAAAGYCAANTG